MSFGDEIRERRQELRLGLREFAVRAHIDPGNLSKIERGRLGAPQTPEVLGRILGALELEVDSEQGRELTALAAVENGNLPPAMLADDDVREKLPLLLRTVHNKKLDGEKLDRLIELIREA